MQEFEQDLARKPAALEDELGGWNERRANSYPQGCCDHRSCASRAWGAEMNTSDHGVRLDCGDTRVTGEIGVIEGKDVLDAMEAHGRDKSGIMALLA